MYNTHEKDWNLRTANSFFENPKHSIARGLQGRAPACTCRSDKSAIMEELQPGTTTREPIFGANEEPDDKVKMKKRKDAHAESDDGNPHFHIQKTLCQVVLIVKITTNKNTDSISAQIYVSFQMYVLFLCLLLLP